MAGSSGQVAKDVSNMKIGSEGGANADPLRWVFQDEHIIGNGSFGVVYQAIVQGSDKVHNPMCPLLHVRLGTSRSIDTLH
jgi:hypothetical protein